MSERKYCSEELTWSEYRKIPGLTKTPAFTLEPNYNIVPSSMMPVVVLERGEPVVRPMQWGLIPTWAKDTNRSYAMAHARVETIEEKPSFKNLLKSCRCAVLVSGFYELKRAGNIRQTFKVERSDRSPIILAGLWADNPVFEMTTYSVITAPTNEQIAPVCKRRPVILELENLDLWLSGSWREAKSLTRQYEGSLSVIEALNV